MVIEIVFRGEELFKFGYGVVVVGVFDIEFCDGNEFFFGK